MTKKEIYQRGIWNYGYLTLLFLLSKHKEQENYEECKIIYDVIKEHSDKHNLNLQTEFNEQAIDEMVESFWKLGYSGMIALANTPAYAEAIQIELKKANG